MYAIVVSHNKECLGATKLVCKYLNEVADYFAVRRGRGQIEVDVRTHQRDVSVQLPILGRLFELLRTKFI